ncbi:MAG: hypothetical protein RLZZ461_597 [Planctomycetota bacterium]|jgi:hypothetical protein
MTDRDTPPTSPPTMSSPPPASSSGPPGRRPLPPLDVRGRVRRAIVAVAVCLSGATPSFALALGDDFSVVGMLAGIVAFMIGLTLISWWSLFRRWSRQPFIRRTLTWVYSARLALSIAWPFLFFIDGFPGILAVGLVQKLGFSRGTYGADGNFQAVEGILSLHGPLGTFVTVILQGILLNLILLLIATGLLVLQRISLPRPEPLVGETFCGRCGQCLDGVPADHACPECGDTGPRWPEPLTWIDRWSWPRLMTFATAIPLVVIGVTGGLLIAFEGGLP